MTSKTPWTPGPWRIVIDDDGNPLSGRPCISAPDELDCSIVHWDGFVQQYWRSARGDKEVHANARLISKAPEMAELLDRFRDHFLSREPDTVRPIEGPTIRETEALLAYIKGEDSA